MWWDGRDLAEDRYAWIDDDVPPDPDNDWLTVLGAEKEFYRLRVEQRDEILAMKAARKAALEARAAREAAEQEARHATG